MPLHGTQNKTFISLLPALKILATPLDMSGGSSTPLKVPYWHLFFLTLSTEQATAVLYILWVKCHIMQVTIKGKHDLLSKYGQEEKRWGDTICYMISGSKES